MLAFGSPKDFMVCPSPSLVSHPLHGMTSLAFLVVFNALPHLFFAASQPHT
jgi:hypothetical protein